MIISEIAFILRNLITLSRSMSFYSPSILNVNWRTHEKTFGSIIYKNKSNNKWSKLQQCKYVKYILKTNQNLVLVFNMSSFCRQYLSMFCHACSIEQDNIQFVLQLYLGNVTLFFRICIIMRSILIYGCPWKNNTVLIYFPFNTRSSTYSVSLQCTR